MAFNMDTHKVAPLSLPNYKKIKIAAGIAVLAGIAFAGGLGLAMVLTPVMAKVPSEVKQKAGFAIFVPRNLPGTFAVAENSFSIQEEAVIFRATDSAGEGMLFSEQKKPVDFNFNNFYDKQMKDVKVVDGTSFSTVLGKSVEQDVTLISIVAEDTWVLISSRMPLSHENAKTISQSLIKG
ncbi:MAG TPA: hypothetical protein VFT87_02695 [Candidatus Saccharimonadales bacterium]|nr:hypothetical protein [Candidatus Saccharimonadales bacterium]